MEAHKDKRPHQNNEPPSVDKSSDNGPKDRKIIV
jgi:hypothetical protein